MHLLLDNVALFLAGIAVGWWLSIWRLRKLMRETFGELGDEEDDVDDARDPYWPPDRAAAPWWQRPE